MNNNSPSRKSFGHLHSLSPSTLCLLGSATPSIGRRLFRAINLIIVVDSSRTPAAADGGHMGGCGMLAVGTLQSKQIGTEGFLQNAEQVLGSDPPIRIHNIIFFTNSCLCLCLSY